MTRTLPLALLLAIAVLGYALRVRSGAQRMLTGSEAAELGTSWLVDDPHTAYHLRRIELGMAADRVPARDRYLNHPAGSEVPWLPLFDTAIAALAERFAVDSRPSADPHERAEGAVEDFALRVPPVLGVLTILAAYWAALGCGAPRAKRWSALLAAGGCAFAPAAIRASELGRLDVVSWVALLAAVLIGLVARALRWRESLDVIFAALAAGFVSGLALASSAAGLALFLGAWVAFLVRVLSVPSEERTLAERAGLCFCAVAAFVGGLPLAEGPWQPGAELLTRWSRGTSHVVLIGAAPFLIATLLRARAGARNFQMAAMACVVGAIVYFLPSATDDLRASAAGWFAAREIASSWSHDGASSVMRLAALTREASPATYLALACSWLALRAWRRPETTLLVALYVALLVATLVESTFAALFVVSAGCLLAWEYAEMLEADNGRSRRGAHVIALLAAVPLAFDAASTLRPPLDAAEREGRVEFVRGLRWMRGQTPSPGPFNAASVSGDYAVLTVPGDALLAAYHARRPTLASDLALPAAASNLREMARALAGDSESYFVRVLHAQGVRYVAVGPRSLMDVVALLSMGDVRDPAFAGIDRASAAGSTGAAGTSRTTDGIDAEAPNHASVLARLVLTQTDASERALAGFTRVYASPLELGVDGRPARAGEPRGPAISIYRLDAPPPAPAQPQMRAR